jgi:hypothetical protein
MICSHEDISKDPAFIKMPLSDYYIKQMVYVIAYFSLIFFGQEMSYTVFELTYLSLSTYIITYKTVKAYVTNL